MCAVETEKKLIIIYHLKPEAGMDRPCQKTAHYNIGTV